MHLVKIITLHYYTNRLYFYKIYILPKIPPKIYSNDINTSITHSI